jgi:tetratricopeptide (TPR) repeat protein
MADEKKVTTVIVDENNNTEVVEKLTGFWNKNSRALLIGAGAIIAGIGGFLAYKLLVAEPGAKKANEALFRAEAYFRQDSLQLALNGDNVNPGFEKIISKYNGTDAANLSHYYAGASYLKLGNYAKAVKHLKDFSTSSKQVQARANCLLADAYAESGKKEEAAGLYKKAGTAFEKDDYNSPEYLFRSGYMYESLGKNKDAIEVYKIIKEKYPRSERGFEIDKYLARLGVTE